MNYKSCVAVLALATTLLSSCFSTRVNEKAAWLSNDKVVGTLQKLNSITMITLSSNADKALYQNICSRLQEKLTPLGINNHMYFFSDADTREAARARAGNDLRNFILYLMPLRGVTSYDEMNNPMLQKQMEFVIETKAGEKIAAGLISIDKETSENKLAGAVAGIVFDYMKKKSML